MKIRLFTGPGTRRWPRFRLSDIPSINGVLSDAGSRIDVVNICCGGALLLFRRRPVPGTSLRLNVVTKDGTLPVKGLVLRSSGFGAEGAWRFQAAVSFDRLLRIPDVSPGREPQSTRESVGHAEADISTIADFLAIDFQFERDADPAETMKLNDW